MALARSTNAVLLDVRTPKEFASGHIPGATNLDLFASDFDARIRQLDKTKTYVVHCAAGGRSSQAAVKLRDTGVTNLIYFESGVKGWEKAGQKIEQSSGDPGR